MNAINFSVSSGKEMSYIYEALSQIDVKELREAREQQKSIKNKHIFDILANRGNVFTYERIWEEIKGIFNREVEQGYLYFEKNESTLRSKDGIYFYTFPSGEEKEVFIDFIPTVAKMRVKPMVIFPKDSYTYISNQEGRNSVAIGKIGVQSGHSSFTFYDLVKKALEKDASDIHINYNFHNDYTVHFKINGGLKHQPQFFIDAKHAKLFMTLMREEAAEHSKGGYNADEWDITQEAKLYYKHLNVNLRLQFTPKGTMEGQNSLVSRLLPIRHINGDVDFKKLGYDDNFDSIMDDAKNYKGGTIYIVGVTASGKSTLLANFIASISSENRIMTVEDPIETFIDKPNVTQHEIQTTGDAKTSITPLDYTRAAKRMDLEWFVPQEVRRDEGNAMVGMLMEMTKAGQGVATTVHIKSAYSVYEGMVSTFGANKESMIEDTLLIINQVLVKKLCPSCRIRDDKNINREKLKKKYRGSGTKYAFTKDLDRFLDDDTVTYLRNDKGCEKCSEGTIRRVPVYEYIKPTVEFILWLSEQDKLRKLNIEKWLCEKEDLAISRNKLSYYVELLEKGLVDAEADVLRHIFS